jgi:hypothetical protein
MVWVVSRRWWKFEGGVISGCHEAPIGGCNRQGDHAMKDDTETSTFALLASEGAFDPLEDGVRRRVRAFIEATIEEELRVALGRGRYERPADGARGQRNGHRERQVIGTFGAEQVKVPRARVVDEHGRSSEWRSKALRRYQRLTKKAEALIASVYLAGTNTRRVKRALFGLFEGAVSKDVVSRAWRKVKTDWEAWCARSLAGVDVVSADPGRDRGQDPDRPKGHGDLGARGDRCATGWAEDPAVDQEHGRREQGRLAYVPRRSRCPGSEGAGVGHRRRRSRPRGCIG